MDIVPIITKDNLSKEQIEYLQKQQTEYKLVNKIKKNPGHISLLIEKQRKSRELLLYIRLLLVLMGFL